MGFFLLGVKYLCKKLMADIKYIHFFRVKPTVWEELICRNLGGTDSDRFAITQHRESWKLPYLREDFREQTLNVEPYT